MRNYIASTTDYNKGSAIQKISDHNDRTHKPDYILDEEYQIYKNESFNFQGGTLEDSYNQLRSARQENSKKFANIRKNENEIIESVIILSEEQAKYYLDNNIPLMDGFKEVAKDFSEAYGMEMMQIDFHADEGHVKDGKPIFNFHAHIISYNFDFDKNQSILRTMRKSDFENMQDIAANAMQKKGFDFVRGISKKESGLKNQTRNDFIIQKQEKEIEINKYKINQAHEVNSILENYKNSLQDEINVVDLNIKTLKSDRDELKNNNSISREEKKVLYSDITQAQKDLRIIRKDLTQEKKTISAFKENVVNDVNKILNYSKKLVGYDEKKLFKAISSKLKEYSSIEVEFKENQALKLNSESLNIENNALIEDNSLLLSELDKKDKRILDLEEISNDKANEIKRLMKKDKASINVTKDEVLQVTQKYESEVSNLQTKLNLASANDIFKDDEIEKLKEFKEFVEDNHNNVVEDFKYSKKNHHRHR